MSPADSTPAIASYLVTVRARHSADAVAEALESLADLRVLVVGDLIVDEYCYCTVSGTVSKWPVIAAVYEDLRRMAGGGAVIARHVRQYARQVEYVCTTGDRDEHGAAVRELLDGEGIRVSSVTYPGTFTVAKRRYITGGYPNPLAHADVPHASIRLFEIGFLPPPTLAPAVEDAVCQRLERALPGADAVIVADFGHGLVTPRVAERVAGAGRWWSVNAQTNSSNFGFNRVTKYRMPNFICIDELEARLPSGSRSLPLEEIVRELQGAVGCGVIMVTQGSSGLSLFGTDGVEHAPALATVVVDPVGAGDAVLAVASLCRARGLDDALTVFLSACAGAVASGIVGNEEPVRKERLLAYAAQMLSARGAPL